MRIVVEEDPELRVLVIIAGGREAHSHEALQRGAMDCFEEVYSASELLPWLDTYLPTRARNHFQIRMPRGTRCTLQTSTGRRRKIVQQHASKRPWSLLTNTGNVEAVRLVRRKSISFGPRGTSNDSYRIRRSKLPVGSQRLRHTRIPAAHDARRRISNRLVVRAGDPYCVRGVNMHARRSVSRTAGILSETLQEAPQLRAP
jgi:hypothetical protein